MGKIGEMQMTLTTWQDSIASNGSFQDVPPDRLEEILAAHKLWVESDKTRGKPSDLTRADLQGRDLSQSNLRDARLYGANLQGALLDGTNFREADLQAADLARTTGLLGEQLGGANLRHAILPKEVLDSDQLVTVTETSRSAQTLLWSMLGACVYAWLTMWTTTDTGLLTNRKTSSLPIIGGTIPIGVFFVVMPLVLLGLYLYLHFQLQRLWEGLARLPAVFPDGRPVDQRVDLWLLNGFLRTYWRHLREGRGGSPLLLLLEKSFAVLLVWGVVPITLVLFWGRYLTVHDPRGTAFHIGLLMVGIGTGIGFRHLMAVTLSGKSTKATGWQSALAVAVCSGAILVMLSFGAISGIPPDQYTLAEDDENWAAPGVPPFTRTNIRIAVPWIFDKIGVTPFANFEEEVTVAPRPSSWMGENKAEISGLETVNLKARNLQHAKAVRAFLGRADMRWTDLTGANLREAELHGANLEGAWLKGANLKWAKLKWSTLLDAKLGGAALVGADLREADLRRADLHRANLTFADLRGADLEAANLQWANLTYARLEKPISSRQEGSLQFESTDQVTNLTGAELSWANLSGANLQAANLQVAKLWWATLTTANLQEADLEGAELHGADLSSADLRAANLVRANLRQANLQRAQLQGTYLFAADLREADLTHVTGLTSEQLELAMTDELTILPAYLRPPAPESFKRTE
jgi:uncharacterized protein YjbI with pentapeptide repeats